MAYTLTTHARIGDIDAPVWDALVQPNEPFTRHAYLHALETTGCVGRADSGWQPLHLVVHEDRAERGLVAAMPLYLKTDSYGEFIFDWSWADASMRAGLPITPSLWPAIPFTPATGRRILRRDDVPLQEAAQALAQGLQALADQSGASSVHVLFCPHDEAQAPRPPGLCAPRQLPVSLAAQTALEQL